MKTKIEITKKQIQHNNDNNKLTRGRKMKYFSIILTVMVTALLGRATEPQTNWSYDQSTQQGFYIFDAITIDGLAIEGDGGGETSPCFTSGTCDVIGAFRRGICSDPAGQGLGETYCTLVLGATWSLDEEICIGWRYANSAGGTTVPLMGSDGSNGFLEGPTGTPGED